MNYELRIGRGWSFRQDYKIGGWVESSAGLSGLTTSDFFGILPQETQKGEMIKLGTQEEGMEVKVKFPHAKTRRREEGENGEWGSIKSIRSLRSKKLVGRGFTEFQESFGEEILTMKYEEEDEAALQGNWLTPKA